MIVFSDLWLPRGRGRSGMDWKFGIGRCKLLHLEWISNKVLLCGTRNYIQSSGLDHDEKYTKKNTIHIHTYTHTHTHTHVFE